MSVIDIGRTLYTGTRALSIVASRSLAVGTKGPAGQYLSNAHKTAVRSSSANNAAKVSYAAVVLEYLLNGRLSALEGESASQVYAEFAMASGETMHVLHTGEKIFWEEEPTQSSHICVPIVLFALQSHSQMEETKGLFAECAEEYMATGVVSEANIYRFCDAFYYEWKEHYPMQIPSDTFFKKEVVKQAIRSGALQSFALFDEIGLITPDIQVESVPTGSAATPTKISDAANFKNCCDGRYVLDYSWSPEQLPHIPDTSKLNSFVPSKQFFGLVDLVHSELNEVIERMNAGEYGVNAIGDNYVNVILVGKPGTGKTTLANALGATFGMPVRVIAPNKHSEEDLFTGMTKVSDGGFRFVETPFLDVYKNGGILLMEEFNLGDPAILMGALGQAIERPFILYEDGYKEVRRHPLCVIISTMNSGTQGSREPSEAFTSRSPDSVMLDDPDEQQFLEILNKKGYPMKECKKVYKTYCKIGAYLQNVNAKDVAMSITMRHCIAALRRICKLGHGFKDAIRDTMIGTIAIKDCELANATYAAVVETGRD